MIKYKEGDRVKILESNYVKEHLPNLVNKDGIIVSIDKSKLCKIRMNNDVNDIVYLYEHEIVKTPLIIYNDVCSLLTQMKDILIAINDMSNIDKELDSAKLSLDMLYEKKNKLEYNIYKIRNQYTAPKIIKMSSLYSNLFTMYEEISLDGSSGIVAITKSIIVPKQENCVTDIDLGKFKVCININNWDIKVFHTEKTDRWHPHIDSAGICCFGSWYKLVKEAINKQNVLELLNIIHQFLCSYYLGGSYVNIYRLLSDNHKVFTDGLICNKCFNEVDNCNCNEEDTCIHCGYTPNECNCLICPNSGDRLEDNSFPDDWCYRCIDCIITLDNLTNENYIKCCSNSELGDTLFDSIDDILNNSNVSEFNFKIKVINGIGNYTIYTIPQYKQYLLDKQSEVSNEQTNTVSVTEGTEDRVEA